MKILKTLGIVVIGLILLVLIAALIAPSGNHVERSVVIDASMDDVRSHTMTFEEMLKWSPWADRDPDQKVTIENDGQVGAVYSWVGQDSLVGSGSQTITGMSENEVVTHLHFTSPMEGEADATTTLEEVDGGVKVTWAYNDHAPYPMNFMNLFLDMEKWLGPDFELGVNRLKALVESEANAAPEMTINEVMLEARTYIGVRDEVGMDGMQDFFASSFTSAYEGIQAAGMNMVGAPTGVYFSWDMEEMRGDLLAGIPVSEGAIDGMDSTTVSGKGYQIDYYGSYEGVGDAHEALMKYFDDNGLTIGRVVLEEYVTDPQNEPDPSNWLTKVTYMVGDGES